MATPWIKTTAVQAATDTVLYGAGAYTGSDPIGGGGGYSDIYTHGIPNDAAHNPTTAAAFMSAVSGAKSGEVVYVGPQYTFDLTGHNGFVVPEGVTIASNRGYGGSGGIGSGSLGGIITNTGSVTEILRPQSYVRITGIRIKGQSGGTSGGATHGGILQDGCRGLEIDNCEIYNCPYAGVTVRNDGLGNDGLNSPDCAKIHHNYIHNCQRNGLGYGTDGTGSSRQIYCNVFDYCRHDVAGQRTLPGAATTNYEVSYNIFETHINNNSLVDCHGGNDSKAWGNPNNPDVNTAAGGTLLIHHNTFKIANQPSVAIRGVPAVVCKVYNNWTYVTTVSTKPTATAFKQRLENLVGAVVDGKSITNTEYVRMEVFDNWYGTAAPPSGTTAAPVADFTATPTFGATPLQVQFTAASLNTPTAWSWDFQNDGTVDSTSQNPTYTYTAAGTYAVKLTVQNSAGSDSEIKTSCITAVAVSPSSTIDMGPGATNRSTSVASAGYTDLEENNPANADGTITSIELWFNTNATGVRVGTFFKTGTNSYQCRDSATLGSVTAGSKYAFTTDSSGNPLSIDVEVGDLIGWYISAGTIEADRSGGNGWYYYHGESIDPGDEVAFTPTTAMYCGSICASG